MARSFNQFYASELSELRNNSLEFARANPAIAPLLGSVSTDPDIERLLEGVAFLNGLTRQKQEDEFPEIVQELASILVPQFLRPLPAAALLEFTPKAALNEAVSIGAGTEIGAKPIEGVSCRFRTTAALDIIPLSLETASTEKQSDGRDMLRLQFMVTGSLAALPAKLRLYLADDQVEAANIFMLLSAYAKEVVIRDQHKQQIELPARIATPGFEEALLPYPDNAFPAFGMLQELLFMPQKFLFVEIHGLEKAWQTLRGNRFRIEIGLAKSGFSCPEISPRNFALNVSPVVNLFQTGAEPIKLEHELAEYLVCPNSAERDYYQIYSIDQVSGYQQGQAEPREYVPFSLLNYSSMASQASYRSSIRPSMNGNNIDTYLSVVYSADEIPRKQTISIELTCTNRRLAEKLKLGDISRPTSTSPEHFIFRNITPVTPSIDPPHGEKLLWDVISHTTLNLLSLAGVENLRAMLHLYNSTCSHDNSTRSANERQIDGLLELNISRETHLLRGMMLQGQHVELLCDETKWPGAGTMYLWGCVLERFLACYASINTYTRFEMQDRNTGTRFTWPMRMGLKPVL